MERLFFAISRGLMLTVAVLAFAVLMFGGLYAIRLYLITQQGYTPPPLYKAATPDVAFETVAQQIQQEQKRQLAKREKIKSYLLSVIAEGSQGHGYADGKMPKALVKGAEAEKIADFIAKGMRGERPAKFGACAACHGSDGRGDYGRSPDLLVLPIFHGKRKLQKSETQNTPLSSNRLPPKAPKDPQIVKILSSLNVYANSVGEDGVSYEMLQKYLSKTTGGYGRDLKERYMQLLQKAAIDLREYGKNYDPKRSPLPAISWRDFLEKFTQEFQRRTKEEEQKVRASQKEIDRLLSRHEKEALETKVKLLFVLQVVGGALLLFVLITMMLVLLKIEKNTRYIGVKSEKDP